ncbi:MAG: tyrosine-type recombinase/integrase, partial [Planctomycetaceae bacterium]|nr:tyrosine-type recombinase/integrase [Planctomycetaceae bacterium]
HHHIARSSVSTISRYRTATEHLLTFLTSSRVPQLTSQFRAEHVEQFIRYLRTIEVHPNGHPNSPRRSLRDKGIQFILQTSRSLFAYAIRKRHLPPYSENPFSALNIDQMNIEDSKPIRLFTPQEETAFLEACDDWQFPLFLTLMLTGMRPGELTHLIFPDDTGTDFGELAVRNRPGLGWQVKTRRERTIPVHPALRDVLHCIVGPREPGLLFRRRRFHLPASKPVLNGMKAAALEAEAQSRIETIRKTVDEPLDRAGHLKVCREIWSDAGMIRTDKIRNELIQVCRTAKLDSFTSPKMLRHLFATTLQDANVDPLIRSELMGHATGSDSRKQPLGMTSVYTHTRPETKRRQLEVALNARSAIAVAQEWLARHRPVN